MGADRAGRRQTDDEVLVDPGRHPATLAALSATAQAEPGAGWAGDNAAVTQLLAQEQHGPLPQAVLDGLQAGGNGAFAKVAQAQVAQGQVAQGQGAQAQAAQGQAAGSGPLSSGVLTQRSFLRENDLKTISTQTGGQVYFDSGAAVSLVAVHPTDPAWIQVSGPAFVATNPPTAVASAQGWVRRAWTSLTLGLYDDLAITDRTGTYGALASGQLPHADVDAVVLHQTGSRTQQSTLNTYQGRVNAGQHVGAQYLIGEAGEISLITSTGSRMAHVGKPKTAVDNSNSIGIEHVGMHHSVTPAGNPPGAKAAAAQKTQWAAEMARVRTDLGALPLSPPLAAQLLDPNLTDLQLFQLMKSNGWNIYGDINGPQKRASHLLTGRLRDDFGLGVGDLRPHEEVSWKVLGEGGNIRDFHVAMEAYPKEVRELDALAAQRADLQKNTTFMDVLKHEKDQLVAVEADATAPENAALAAERAAQPGAATGREAVRVAFYDDFWPRATQLTELLKFLKGPSGADAGQLTALLAKWRR